VEHLPHPKDATDEKDSGDRHRMHSADRNPGLPHGWWGEKFDDASIALISAMLVGATLVLSFLGRKARKEERER